MLTICIALYNFDVRELIKTLIGQMRQLNAKVDIIVRSDKSEEKYNQLNREITQFEEVNYIEGSKNIGRAANRNQMAKHAKTEYLLFIDCDAMPENNNFIKNYINAATENRVVCGGTSYQKQKPGKHKMLRWMYGKQREHRPAILRNKNPYKSFSSFSFLIPKTVFLRIRFDETIAGYGHEDTIFGIQLEKHGIEMYHINNYLIHTGLETNKLFIEKTATAVHNLFRLYMDNKYQLNNNIKLISVFNNIKNKKILIRLIAYIFEKADKAIKKQLCTSKPSLFLFDLYKLALFCRLYIRKEKNN